MSVRTVPAAEISRAEHAALWTEAFSDYFTPGVFTADSLAAFELAFDLDRAASRIVLEDDRPVAFAMLGLREAVRGSIEPPGSTGPVTRGWVGGMGVIPSARRRGHGERAMEGILEAARERKLATVGLEVLVQNVAAIPLYERLGFRTLRKLEVWERAAAGGAGETAEDGPREIPVEDAVEMLGGVAIQSLPWQRELGAVRRAFPDLGALSAEAPDGHAVLVHRTLPERSSLVAIGGDGAGRAAALERLLVSFFAARCDRPIRLLNLGEGDPAAPALERAGAIVTHRQWEMELSL